MDEVDPGSGSQEEERKFLNDLRNLAIRTVRCGKNVKVVRGVLAELAIEHFDHVNDIKAYFTPQEEETNGD